MSKTEKSDFNKRQLLISIAVVIIFGAILGVVISRLNNSEVNYDGIALKKLALTLEESATSAHWRWRAQNSPDRLLLTHYDKSGNEIGRSPVSMSKRGWPKVLPSSEGCEKLWNSLLTVPMEVNEFKVFGDYYRESSDYNNSARCRFRLGVGDYFDYYVADGKVLIDSESP